jgi:hypothetical protein
MRVILAPVVIDGRICRVVSAIDTLLEVEEWVGAWWEPSLVTISDAARGTPASDALLLAGGVPPTDWIVTEARSDAASVLRQLRPALPTDGLAPDVDPPPLPPLDVRFYAGNARFNRKRRVPLRDEASPPLAPPVRPDELTLPPLSDPS